jgi:hypothetical protein
MRIARLARRALGLSTGALLLLASSTRADDVLHPGAVNLDRPTLVTLGVQLLVTGDDNHDATVGVRYRPVGGNWHVGRDLFRVHPEDIVGRTVPEQFAGSIFDLQPATTYDIELHATDPDGPVDQILTTQASTRGLPVDPAVPSPKSVTTADELQAALNAAQPGDVITLADGTYRGSFTLAASGTAANPIVIRGTSRDGVILDGHQCKTCNTLEIDGSFVHVESLTLTKAVRALRLKTAGTEGNVVRHVHFTKVVVAIVGDPDQRDFYICDNLLEGKLRWPRVYSRDHGRHASDDGINVKGFGHVVCHNTISGFGDALKVEEDGSRADDFYGNEVLWTYDNAIELDTSEGNTRAFRNRFTNSFVPISFQPVFGGPVYALRNVVVNVAEDQLKFYGLGTTPDETPSGILVLHNTFVSPEPALLMASTVQSSHFVVANNVFVGNPPVGQPVVQWSGVIDDGTFDYDGWSPDGAFDLGAGNSWPSFGAMQGAGLFETHGRILAGATFANGLIPPPRYKLRMAPTDATLASGSNAVDAGTVMANVNDGFTGSAPDLGALELGCPLPIFGVRPDGIDETNEPIGCPH